MPLKLIATLILLIGTKICYSQITDDFSDGDFTSNPVWSGDTNYFIIEDNLLRSNNDPDISGTGKYYLSTPSQIVYDASWEFFVNLNFSTSGVNYTDIYLMSDNENLNNVQNGYFVRIGGTDDEIVLYKKFSGIDTPLIDVLEDTVDGSSDNIFIIKVVRSVDNNWTLSIDDGNTGSLNEIGSIADSTINISSYFGIRIVQSGANAPVNNHFFDDFKITGSIYPDLILPQIRNLEVVSSTVLKISFTEDLIKSTAENISNYYLDKGINIISSFLDDSDQSLVHLEVSALLNGTIYSLTIDNIKDLAGNVIDVDSKMVFEYIFIDSPSFRDVVVNEFITDPDTLTKIPNVEFVELYNSSDKYFNIEKWKVGDNSSLSDEFAPYILRPDSYVLICSIENVSVFNDSVDIIGVAGFPNFNSSTIDAVVLMDINGIEIDHVDYSNSPRDGISYEQINPFKFCSGEFNFNESNHPDGGTPGTKNSVFNNEIDVTNPEITNFLPIDPKRIQILFSEPIDTSLISLNSFFLEGNVVTSFEFNSFENFSIILDDSLVSEQYHVLELNNITDCEGNSIADSVYKFYFDRIPPKLEKTVILSDTEIALIFHEALNEAEAERESNFILDSEISVKAILQDTASKRIHLKFNTPMIVDQYYQLHFENQTDTIGNVSDFDSITIHYNDWIDTVIVLTNDLILVDFSTKPDFETAMALNNYLVDNGIGNPIGVYFDESDLSIIRLQLKNNISENKEFSIYIENIKDSEGITIPTPERKLFWDTKPPTVSNLSVLSDSSLSIQFNEPVRPLPAINLNNYWLENEIIPSEIILLTQDCVEIFFDFSLPIEQELELSITRQIDHSGNKMNTIKREKFTYDPRPPGLDSIQYLDQKHLRLFASEKVDFHALNFSDFYVNDTINPTGITIQGPDSILLQLEFGMDLLERQNVNFTISQWSDIKGNMLAKPIKAEFNTLNPSITELEVIDDTTLHIEFSHEMNYETFDLRNYTISENIIIALKQLSSSSLNITLGSNVIENETNQLSVNSILSKKEHPISKTIFNFAFETYFDNAILIDSQTVELKFTTEFSSLSVNNFRTIEAPLFLSIDSKNPGVLRMFFRSPFQKNQKIKLSWTDVIDRFGRKIPNHYINIIWDTKEPELLDVQSHHFGSASIIFNEPVESNSIQTLEQFKLGESSVKEWKIESDTSVLLSIPELEESKMYTLFVYQISDLNGNINIRDSINFSYNPPLIPNYSEVLITEIMVDPTPSVDHFEEEYIEIFNNTVKDIDISTLKIADKKDTASIPYYLLQTGEYLVLSSKYLENVSNQITIENLPTLDNSGDSIKLLSINHELIDEVNYSNSWYHDPQKNDGGYSLEIINPNAVCDGILNWRASVNSSGGTPGFQNSVFNLKPDSIPPFILSSTLLDSMNIVIHFSEIIDSSTFQYSNFQITQGVNNLIFISNEEVLLSFNHELDSGIIYQMMVSNISDCEGNVIAKDTLNFGIGLVPEFGEIVISEIMYDPDPVLGLPQSEYIEIYNRTDKLLNLDQIFLMNEKDESAIIKGNINPKSYLLLVPQSNIEMFESTPTIALNKWAKMNNTEGYISLRSTSKLLYQIEYANNWHDSEEKKKGGYSLEIIDPDNICSGIGNWTSSINVIGGTPGYKNSIYGENPDQSNPEMIRASVISPDTILCTFNESIYPTKNLLVEIDEEVSITTNYDEIMPNQIILTFSPPLKINKHFKISIQNLTDCAGNALINNEVFIIIPESSGRGLIINEILFNPKSGGYDFIEIYNNSSAYYSLDDIMLGNGKTLVELNKDQIISPGEYLVFTESAVQLLFDYPSANASNIIELKKIPSMPNEEGSINLLSASNELLDSVHYQENFHSGLLENTEGVSLERISFNAPSQDSQNWNSASGTFGFATPGYKNSQSLEGVSKSSNEINAEPKIFVPGSTNPTFSSFTAIHYEFEHAGLYANVGVYDSYGRLVKTLANGSSMSTSGFLKWDGTSNGGTKVRTGSYLIIFEVFGRNGYKSVFKETVVAGFN